MEPRNEDSTTAAQSSISASTSSTCTGRSLELFLDYLPESTSSDDVKLASQRGCHVSVSNSPHHSIAPSLTGRETQRYDGKVRLVCGCVPFRVDRLSTGEVQLRVLLVQAQKRADYIFPKGGWESYEDANQCALRESLEEGGVEGELVAQFESFEFASKKGKVSRLTPFLLYVTKFHTHFAEEDKRKREWVLFNEVDSRMQRDETMRVWQCAKDALLQLGFLDAESKPVYRTITPNTPMLQLSKTSADKTTTATSSS